jgi:ABC-type glycerol-3-phosphate transport system substrate-binding protein
VASLWIGIRGEAGPARNRVIVEPPVTVITDTPANRSLPIPPTETPLTIDASGHVTITFACDEAIVVTPEYRALGQSFEAQNPDVTVRFIGWQEAVSEWQSRTATHAGVSRADTMRAISGGSDVFCTDNVAGLIREGRVRSLTPLARADAEFAVEEFYPPILQQVTEQGSLYLIPARFRPTLIRYDPAIFEGAGLRAPRPGWSWDDLLAAAAALTQREGADTRRWGFGENDSGTLMRARFWSGVGASRTAASQAAANPFSQQEVLDLFRWYDEFYLEMRAAPIPPGVARSSADAPPSSVYEEAVRQGLFAMWTDGLAKTPPAGARAAPFPVSRAFDDTTPFEDIEGWAISSEAMHVDAAWRWVSFLSQNLPPDPEGRRAPARRSVPQMQAFWNAIDPQDRESYQYALEHLGSWPALSEADGSHTLWRDLLAMIRGETTLAALAAPESTRTASPVEPSEVITLTFAAPRNQQGGYEQAALAFGRANPGIRIRVVPSESLLSSRSETEILWSQMRVMAQRVDAMAMPEVAALVRSGRSEGILYDLTDMISESVRSADYYPNTLEGLQWRGRSFALPGRVGLHLIHYNEWMFDQMEVAYPQAGWRWRDFDRTVRAVSLRGNSTSSWWGLSEGTGNGRQLLRSRTGPLVGFATDPPTALLDRSRAIEAVAWYAGLLADDIIAPSEGRASEAAMCIAPADLARPAELRSAGIGVAPFPVDPGLTATTPLEIYDASAVSASTDHPEAAWQWLLHLQMNPPAAGYGAGALSARRDGNPVLAIWEDDEVRSVIEYALEHTQRPAPLRAEEYLVGQQLTAALKRIVEEGQDEPAAMKQAQEAAQKDLGRR